MDIKDVKHLAEIARLEISDSEGEALLLDLKTTLSYIEQIEKAPLPENYSPEAGENYNQVREDVVTHEGGEFSEAILAQAVAKEGGYIKVKKVL